MIRPVTTFWGASAGVAVAMLFVVSYQVQERERELDHLNRAILASKTAIHVLHAEWAYLTRPDRLERLSVTHLKLAPIPPERIVRIEDLPLPPAEPPPADPPPAVAAETVRAPAGTAAMTSAATIPAGMRAIDVRASGGRASGVSAQGLVR